MALTSFKLSLKRRRSSDGDGDYGTSVMQREIRKFAFVTIMKNGVPTGYDCLQSIRERSARCVSQTSAESCNPNSSNKASRRQLIRNPILSFHAILISIAILLSGLSTSRFVHGEILHRQLHRFENSYFQHGDTLNRIWEEGDRLLRHNLDRDVPIAYGNRKKQGRELSGEELERYIRHQRASGNIDEKPITESFSQPPDEIDASPPPSSTQPPVDERLSPSTKVKDSFKNGNPLIQSVLPINFSFDLLVRDATTNELLQGLETVLENYFQSEYQKLADRDDVSKPTSKTLKLGKVDLTLSLIESKWWQERHLRRLRHDSSSSSKGSWRSNRRKIQEGGQVSNTKLMTISVDGAVNYSMQVDGSLPTPDDIEEQWSEAFVDIASQNQLQRTIEGAGIEGVIRLEQVQNQNSIDQSSNGSPADTTNSTGSSNNENIASLYEDDEIDNNDNNSSGTDVEGDSNKKNASQKTSELERPSLLSIIFGFILTGIAALGLVGYAYLFYRKRKKHLQKKKKMKESITFSSANIGAAATPASKRNSNSQYYSKSVAHSTPNSAQTPPQMFSSPMMLSQSGSEETSYKGLDSSLGSEDISDSFANELKLAASLDQEAWDESQRIKENIAKRQVTRFGSNNHMVSKSPKPSSSTPMPSLLSNGPRGLEEEDEITEENTAWVKSFPYGDEGEKVRVKNHNESSMPSSSNQWEPYNSALPPLMEEKKDETSPSEFFAQKLRNIEQDLTVSGGKSVESPRKEASIPDDTSDIISEVSELSKYVRRYERRKDRKIKREESIHERRTVEGPQSHSSAYQTMAVGMDGKVYYKAQSSNDYHRPTPSSTSRLQTSTPLSSYKESFRDAEERETSISFVSDDEEDEEERNERRQRLGISPYRRSKDEVVYKNGRLQNEDNSTSNRSQTLSSRSRSTRTGDDYRYSVGYNQDLNKSSSSRLSDLRSNDAIIDNSSSVVSYGASPLSNEVANDRSKNSWSAANKGNGIARPNSTNVNRSKNTEAITSTVDQQRNEPRPQKNSNRVNKLRGMFEQKTNGQPAPVYPPGANWQNGGSLGR